MRNLLFLLLFSFVLLLPCCGSDDSGSSGGDADLSEQETGESDLDEGLFHNPHDGQLYVAAGSRTITPTSENHPCDMFIGGTSSNRRPKETHDDLEARAIVLQQDGEHAVLVSMDLVGWIISDVDKVWDRLEALGVDPDHVTIASTHTHTAPDSVGIWGPSDFESGRCPEYIDFLVDTVVDLVVELSETMVPVEVYATETTINVPESNHPNLLSDSRRPNIMNDHFTLARFDDMQGQTVATMLNWHNHPECMIEHKVYSADFPRWTRLKMEQELGGVCVYFSGTVGGLMTTLGVDVPERTEDGEPVLEDGQTVLATEEDEVKTWSFGYVLAEIALEALADAPKMEQAFEVDDEYIEIPLDNIVFVTAFELGILEPYDEMVLDNPDVCGFGGCFPYTIQYVRIGSLHMVSLPGEVFSETSVGRPASSFDWSEKSDGEYGIKEYPAITGYRETLPNGHLLMEFGLANNEIGYIIPYEDMHPSNHPDNYEEYFSAGLHTEQILREGVIRLLERHAE